jgi:hypothetical protein
MSKISSDLNYEGEASIDVEKLSAAIDAADRGHRIELMSLAAGKRTYMLDMRDGSIPLIFSSIEDAQDHSDRYRSLARARAALSFLGLASTPNDEAGIKPASQPSTPNDE